MAVIWYVLAVLFLENEIIISKSDDEKQEGNYKVFLFSILKHITIGNTLKFRVNSYDEKIYYDQII